jgi:hypothetical protein
MPLFELACERAGDAKRPFVVIPVSPRLLLVAARRQTRSPASSESGGLSMTASLGARPDVHDVRCAARPCAAHDHAV